MQFRRLDARVLRRCTFKESFWYSFCGAKLVVTSRLRRSVGGNSFCGAKLVGNSRLRRSVGGYSFCGAKLAAASLLSCSDGRGWLVLLCKTRLGNLLCKLETVENLC